MKKIMFVMVAAVLLLAFSAGTGLAAAHAHEPRACIQALCANGNEVFFCGSPNAWYNVIAAVCGQPNGNNG